MTTYDWFKVFNKTEFEALDLVSKTYIFEFDGLGEKSVQVYKGNYVSVFYGGVFLVLNLNGKNPYEFEGYAVFLDDNQDVWLGIEQSES